MGPFRLELTPPNHWDWVADLANRHGHNLDLLPRWRLELQGDSFRLYLVKRPSYTVKIECLLDSFGSNLAYKTFSNKSGVAAFIKENVGSNRVSTCITDAASQDAQGYDLLAGCLTGTGSVVSVGCCWWAIFVKERMVSSSAISHAACLSTATGTRRVVRAETAEAKPVLGQKG